MHELTNFRKREMYEITKLKSLQGTVIVDKEQICDELASEFEVLTSSSNMELLNEKIKQYEINFVNTNSQYKMTGTNVDEVVSAMEYVKRNVEDINIAGRRIYKNFKSVLCIPLVLLINSIFRLCIIPDKFKVSQCTPLYKGKGSKFLASSFRAIKQNRT